MKILFQNQVLCQLRWCCSCCETWSWSWQWSWCWGQPWILVQWSLQPSLPTPRILQWIHLWSKISYVCLLQISYHYLLQISYHFLCQISYHFLLQISYHCLLQISCLYLPTWLLKTNLFLQFLDQFFQDWCWRSLLKIMKFFTQLYLSPNQYLHR